MRLQKQISELNTQYAGTKEDAVSSLREEWIKSWERVRGVSSLEQEACRVNLGGRGLRQREARKCRKGYF